MEFNPYINSSCKCNINLNIENYHFSVINYLNPYPKYINTNSCEI